MDYNDNLLFNRQALVLPIKPCIDEFIKKLNHPNVWFEGM